MNKRLLVGFLTIAISFSMVGCGKSMESTADVQNKEVSVRFNEPVKGETEKLNLTFSEQKSSSSSQIVSNSSNGQRLDNMSSVSQKIIYTGQVNLETIEFEKDKSGLCQYISSIGGFIQSSTVHGTGIGYGGLKSAEYVFRIPKAKYSQSFIDLKKFGTVVLEQSNGEDVTEQYFDTEARLKSLKIQQERLQELLKKAVKMEDILKIEKELQTTLYEIENYTGTLKKWDSLVEYSTLSVNISEVEKIKPITPKEKDGFFERIALSFKNSVIDLGEFLQDIVIALAAALPALIPLGLIGYFIYRVMRKKIKKIKNNRIKVSESINSENVKNDDIVDDKDK